MALVGEFLQAHIPNVKLVKPEGTYLAWLDFSELGLSVKELDTLVTDKCKLWLSSGHIFGAGGKNFQRMNIAYPRSVLYEALGRLRDVN